MPKKTTGRTAGEPLQPYWSTTDKETVRLYQGDVLSVLKRMPSRSVQMVVTSPPYWGLRDYGTAEWEGGNSECNHESAGRCGRNDVARKYPGSVGKGLEVRSGNRNLCRCGARRIDAQLGSELTPDCLGWATGIKCGGCHVCKMVTIFHEVRRVLRNDGTLWLNYGDTYATGSSGSSYTEEEDWAKRKHRAETRGYDVGGTPAANRMGQGARKGNSFRCDLVSGNLVGVPWRVALALQADGWILKQDVIWYKPSAMPESVRKRCSKAHEYIFLLAARNDYYFDCDAIREKTGNEASVEEYEAESGSWTDKNPSPKDKTCRDTKVARKSGPAFSHPNGRNKRSVWAISSHGYEGAHFATFPPKLIEPCILAGTSEYGACAECGTPWERKLEKESMGRLRANGKPVAPIPGQKEYDMGAAGSIRTKTTGWKQTCSCGTTKVSPCVVLDPFVGSGTTAVMCLEHGRRCWGVELSEVYLRDNAIPRIEGDLLGRVGMAHLIGR